MRIALATCDAARDLDEDLAPLAAALADRGATAELPAWDDPGVDWAGFDAVVVRSTWNYTHRPEAFLDWVRRTAGCTLLLNEPAHIAWNLDKRYMAALGRAGVATVPTRFIAPGESADLPDGELVVKPSVGAGSMDAARHTDPAAARDHIARLHATGRTAMVQPYLARVEADGESGMVHIDGRLSHTVRKGPMLTGDRALVGGLFLDEELSHRTAPPAEIALAQAALSAVPGPTPFYARVDVVPGPTGPVVLELELVEPSLFIGFAPESGARFAGALAARIASARRAPSTPGTPSSW